MKYKICIEEQVIFTHEMIIEVDHERITEEELDNILDKAQKEGRQLGWDYIENSLKHQGIEVSEVCEDESGDISDVEISDLFEID